MTTRHPVTVIGDIMRDIVASPNQPIRHDTDTPARIDVHVGGSAANTAVWLGHLGAPATFAGRAGADDLGWLREYFSAFGVTPFVQADSDHPTGSLVVIVEGQSRSMLTDRGANVHLDATAIDPAAYADCGVLHLTGYSFFHAEHPQRLIDLIDRVRGGGALVSVDCSSVGFLADFGVERWWEVLSHVDIVRGNADEAAFITGSTDPVEATAAIAARGHTAVITRGADGALWCEQDGEVGSAPAAPLGRGGYVDPTGAGDSFSAGFLDGLSRGNSVEQAVRSGLELSARVVGQWGASPS